MRDDRPPLGRLSVDEFMRRYWQREPLLIRQALPGFVAPVPPERLFELAGSEDAQSRLIATRRGRWSLRHGPIEPGTMPSRRTPNWTVLVQGVDALDDDVHALMSRFRFVPDARLDDLMISFATDGGGVGPHQDFYDVFLIQAHGRRRWRVGPPCDEVLVPGMPVKILAHFAPDREWVLEPGDMLYLPPRWGHDGIADGECMTCSVGFRVPCEDDLATDLLQRLSDPDEDDDAPPRLYHDAGQAAVDRPGEVPQSLLDFARQALNRRLNEPGALELALGEALTEPKPRVWFPAGVPADLSRGLCLDRRTRMMYDAHHVYINGQAFRIGGRDARLLRGLADARCLSARDCAAFSDEAADVIGDWLCSGWLHALESTP